MAMLEWFNLIQFMNFPLSCPCEILSSYNLSVSHALEKEEQETSGLAVHYILLLSYSWILV